MINLNLVCWRLITYSEDEFLSSIQSPESFRMTTWALLIPLLVLSTSILAIDVPVPTNCIMSNGRWVGGSAYISNIYGVADLDDCATRCNNHAQCEKATFRPSSWSNRCYLYRAGANWQSFSTSRKSIEKNCNAAAAGNNNVAYMHT